MNTLLAPLTELGEYGEITRALDKKGGKASVSGCVDSQKLHMIYGTDKDYEVKLIVTYSDINRVQVVNVDNPDVAYINGFTTRLIDKLAPITMPYFPADKKFKVVREEFLTDPKNGDYDTVAYLYVITPEGKKVELNGYFKNGENGLVRIDKAEYDERKARKVEKK